jgi:hypothetical protein
MLIKDCLPTWILCDAHLRACVSKSPPVGAPGRLTHANERLHRKHVVLCGA